MKLTGIGNGNPLQYSCWKSPWTQEPGGVQSMGLQRVRHQACTNPRNIGTQLFIRFHYHPLTFSYVPSFIFDSSNLSFLSQPSKGFSILLVLSKNQFLVSLIFSVFLFSSSLIFTLFLLLPSFYFAFLFPVIY